MFDTYADLRRTVRDFAATEVTPRISRMETSGEIERGLVADLARQGWIGVTVPRAHGGMGLGHTAKTVIVEEFSRVSGAMGAAAQASILGVAKLLHFGTAEQQREWLPQIAAGSCLPTIAVTEAESGGHVLGMESTGRRKGKSWVLNGRKVFVGNSHLGHVHGVVVRTGKGSQGLSAFLVEHDRKGVSLTPHEPRLGLHGFSYGELVLDDVRVPDGNRIGEVGQGVDVAYSSSVLYGRLNLAAVAIGLHHATAEQAAAYVAGRPRIASEGTVRARVGKIAASLRISRLAVYYAAHLLDRGEPCDLDLMAAKQQCVAAAQRAAALGMKIHAAHGLLTGLPMERLHRDAQCVEPPAGTGDIQLHRIASAALSPQDHPQWSERFARPVPVPPATAPALPPGHELLCPSR
ncbi:acyl-CoA dehydrogenase family protein [Streptomyces sp. NPDC001889]